MILTRRLLACVAAALLLTNTVTFALPERATYFDPSLPIDKRVDDLMSRMTLDEKIGQLNQLFYFPQFMKPDMIESGLREGKIGSLLFVTDPATINRFQKVAVEQSRLKMPLLFGFDAIPGFRTIFPVPL